MIKNFLIITTIGILALGPLFFVNKAEAKIVPDCGRGYVNVPRLNPKIGTDGKPMVDATGHIVYDEKNPKKDNSGNIIYDKELANPCDFNDAMELIRKIINFLLFTIATPIAGLVICYAGFQLLTSGGSSEKKTKAKHVLMNVILGYLLALGAWLIVNTIFTTFNIAPCQNWLGKTINTEDCNNKTTPTK